MSDLPADVAADLCELLQWLNAHPSATWEEMGELRTVYNRWRQIVHDQQLLEHTTYHGPGRVSAYGRIFLSTQGHRGEQQPADAQTIWYHGDRAYSADGQTLKLVPPEQHNILQAFLERDIPLLTSKLEEAGTSNVSKVMKAINSAFPKAVRMPERKGDGYYVRVRTKR